jgi:cell division protein FtsZ
VSLLEYQEVLDYITRNADPDAMIIIGSAVDGSLDDKIQVTVIATGFLTETVKIREANKTAEKEKNDKNIFIDYNEWEKITERPGVESKSSGDYLSQRSRQDTDLNVPAVFRKLSLEKDSIEKTGSRDA